MSCAFIISAKQFPEPSSVACSTRINAGMHDAYANKHNSHDADEQCWSQFHMRKKRKHLPRRKSATGEAISICAIATALFKRMEFRVAETARTERRHGIQFACGIQVGAIDVFAVLLIAFKVGRAPSAMHLA
jgi:hypothetical protein